MNDQHTFQYLKQFLTDERLGKIEHFAPESSDFVLPVMEDIFQFRNAAAIVRSVEACGFHKIVAMESENEFNPNLRVTKGAETWVEVEKMPHQLESLKKIKEKQRDNNRSAPSSRASGTRSGPTGRAAAGTVGK